MSEHDLAETSFDWVLAFEIVHDFARARIPAPYGLLLPQWLWELSVCDDAALLVHQQSLLELVISKPLDAEVRDVRTVCVAPDLRKGTGHCESPCVWTIRVEVRVERH